MMFHADSLAGFCSSASLWALSHTSRSIRLHFLRFAIGSVPHLLDAMSQHIIYNTYAPYVTTLIVFESFNRNAFPKLKHLILYSQILNNTYLSNIKTFEWYPTHEPHSKDVQWPESLTSLTLSYPVSFGSYPPNLLALKLCDYSKKSFDYDLFPSSLTSLNSARTVGPFLIPQCSHLTTLIANYWNDRIETVTFPKTLTCLKLANYTGYHSLDCIVDCVPNLKILKVPRLQHLYEIPHSVIHLSLGLYIHYVQPGFHFHTVTKKTKEYATYWVYKRIPNSRSN